MDGHLNKITKIIISGALAVIIWIVGIIIGQEQTVTILSPEGGLGGIISRTRSAQVSLMLDYGTGRIKVYPEIKVEYGSSALNLLERIENIDNDFNLEYTLEKDQILSYLSLNGYPNFEVGKKWLIWIDNVLQTDDLNNVRLKSGDVIEIKYIKLLE